MPGAWAAVQREGRGEGQAGGEERARSDMSVPGRQVRSLDFAVMRWRAIGRLREDRQERPWVSGLLRLSGGEWVGDGESFATDPREIEFGAPFSRRRAGPPRRVIHQLVFLWTVSLALRGRRTRPESAQRQSAPARTARPPGPCPRRTRLGRPCPAGRSRVPSHAESRVPGHVTRASHFGSSPGGRNTGQSLAAAGSRVDVPGGVFARCGRVSRAPCPGSSCCSD